MKETQINIRKKNISLCTSPSNCEMQLILSNRINNLHPKNRKVVGADDDDSLIRKTNLEKKTATTTLKRISL